LICAGPLASNSEAGDFFMRDPNRIDRIIELLRQAWHRNPDWRLNQLIINAADVPSRYYKPVGGGLRAVPEDDFGLIFYIEDDIMEKRLKGMTGPHAGPPAQK